MDFVLVHDSWATECNQYLKCCLSAHEAHCFTCARLSQMCFAISHHYFIEKGTVDTRVYSVEIIYSCTEEMLLNSTNKLQT